MGSVRPGRLHLSARNGRVSLTEARLEAWLGSASAQRLRWLDQRAELEELPGPRDIPLQGPLDTIPVARLTEGLGEEDAQLALAIRRQAISGDTREALREAVRLRERSPEVRGPAFLVGAIRMVEATAPSAAVGPLRQAGSVPGARSLLGDALWAVGELDEAQRVFTAAADVGGQALVEWGRGRRDVARRLLAQASSRGCRSAGRRLRLLDDLILVSGAPEFAGKDAEGDGVLVRSDLHVSRSRRLAAAARRFLASCRAWLPGEGQPRPLTVLVCGTGAVYERWNQRLGGVRFQDSDGVYRPGTGLLMILDDDDPDVVVRRLQHELVHHVVWERGWALPRPFEEGLAELLAQSPSGDVSRSVTALVPGRFRLARDLAGGGSFADPAELLLRDDLGDGRRGREDYAQAWAALWALGSRGEEALRSVVLKAADLDRRREFATALREQVRAEEVRRLLLEPRR